MVCLSHPKPMLQMTEPKGHRVDSLRLEIVATTQQSYQEQRKRCQMRVAAKILSSEAVKALWLEKLPRLKQPLKSKLTHQ